MTLVCSQNYQDMVINDTVRSPTAETSASSCDVVSVLGEISRGGIVRLRARRRC